MKCNLFLFMCFVFVNISVGFCGFWVFEYKDFVF